MASLIEVKILTYTIVLPLLQDSTVISIARAALEEFKGFNLKKPPQKVLFVQDSKGRILSGNLLFPIENIENKIEVVVEDYSSNDFLAPVETEGLYREWQQWTLTQLKEHIQSLSFQDLPSSPSKQVLDLVQELSASQAEDVQLGCLSVYRTLLRKFPDKAVVMSAAHHISRMFSHTTFPNVAVFALESFKDLSPLQLRLFDSVRQMGELLQVERQLTRFGSAVQGTLFAAFEHVLELIDDAELKGILEKAREKCLAQGEEGEIGEGEKKGEGEEDDEREGGEREESTGRKSSPKKVNLGRIQSLLVSEDKKIRLYALEKVKKLFLPPREAKRAEEGEASISPPLLSIQEEFKGFVFQSEQELMGLLQALFLALKNSIKARPPPSSKSNRERKVSPTSLPPPASSSSLPIPPLLSAELSTAAQLIQTGLRSPETDLPSLYLTLDCLKLIFLSPATDLPSSPFSSSLLAPPLPTVHIRSRKINAITGKPLSSIQKIFLHIAREHYRLLFTLSHAEEGKREQFSDVAEQAALFFSLTVFYGMPQGWEDCALKLEFPTLASFLSVQSPNYKLFMGLTFCLHLARRTEMKGRGPEALITPQPDAAEAIHRLKDVLFKDNYSALRSLWWWCIGERSNFLIRRYALASIAPATTLHEIAHFLWKLDPIPRLLEIMTRAYRYRKGRHLTFLQTDKKLFKRLETYEDDYEEHLSDSYSDTDYSSGDDKATDKGHGGSDSRRHSSRADLHSRDSDRYGYRSIKADHKIIRSVLKIMFNLVQVPEAPFTAQNRTQLTSYLHNLEIGVDPEKGNDGVTLREIVMHDKIASFYYGLLTEITTS